MGTVPGGDVIATRDRNVGRRPRALRHARYRFWRASGIGGLFSTPIFYWMVTGGRFNPLRAEPFGNVYDLQARSILQGRWNVPARQVTFEGFHIHGKTYVYFGPVPAILRLPIVAITHSLDGRLTQVSMLLAFVVLLCFAARLSWRIRCIVRGVEPVSRFELWAVGSYTFLIGTGSVVLFLGSRALVYHEAELWGAAFALGAYDAILALLAKPTRKAVVWSVVWTTLAFLTRASIGAGPVVALGIITAAVAVRRAAVLLPQRPDQGIRRAAESVVRRLGVSTSGEGRTSLLGLAVGVALPVVLYGYVNLVRFGTLFSLPLNKQVYTQYSASRRHALTANGGSLFGFKFVPTQVVQLLRPDALRFSGLFPWVNFPSPATVIGQARFDTRDWASSIPSSMPLLAVLGIVGLVVIVRRQRRPGVEGCLAMTRPLLLGSVVGGLITLTIGYVANRYLSDFLPAIVLTSLVGMHCLLSVHARRRRSRWTQTIGIGLVILAVASVWINFALAISYQRLLFPAFSAERAGFLAFQHDVDGWFPGGPWGSVRTGVALPRTGTLGDVFVIGRCESLYWSDSHHWFPIERANAAGHFRLRVRFPPAGIAGQQALVSIGTSTDSNVLLAQTIAATKVQFTVQIAAGTIATRAASVPTGRPVSVDVILDRREHNAQVSVNGHTALNATVGLVPGSEFSVGGPVGSPPAAPFSGDVRSERVPTPLCDSLKPAS